ncbi:MAG: ABC transporter permease [Vicinamibacterales bacterium]
MRFLPLVWSNLLRRKVRTVITLLSILVAFTLLGTLLAIRVGFTGGVTVAGAERLMMLDKVSLVNSLPIGYQVRIAGVAGVADVTHANWFGGVFQDPKNAFPNLAVDAESWLRVHPELAMPPDQRAAWLADRTGALVGVETARRFGWRVGDRVPLQGTIYRRPDGRPWELTIDAIYDSADPNVDRTRLFLHYAYLNETLPRDAYGSDAVSWFVIKVVDPRQAGEVAARLDALFANSSSETKTATEKVFVASLASQVGDIGTIMIGIAGAVLFTILLVTGNTMAQAVRERTGELAVLKTLGFGEPTIVALILTESCLLALVGGAAGLGLSTIAIALVGDPTHGMLPPIYLPRRDVTLAVALMALLGVVSGLIPAVQAWRLRIVVALRKP